MQVHHSRPRARAWVWLAFLLSAFATQSFAQVSGSDVISADVFARLPTFTDIEISPSGRYMAARVNDENRYVLGVFDVGGEKITRVYAVRETDETSVGWFRWMSDDHLLVSTFFVAAKRSLVPTGETRLLSLDVKKKDLVPLYRNRRNKRSVQIQDRIVSYLPNEPDHILVQYSESNPAEPEVHKINVTKTSSHRRVEMGRYGVQRWMADRNGNVRIGSGLANESVPYMIARAADDRKWLDLSHRVNSSGYTFRPLGFSTDPNVIYVRSSFGGDTDALHLFNIANDEFVEEVYRHPEVDIVGIGVDSVTGELERISFIEESGLTYYVKKRPIDEAVEDIRNHYQDYSVSQVSNSLDGNHAALFFQSPDDPGRHFLFDRESGDMRNLPSQYPGLGPSTLGKTFVTEYAARDGLTIPAFVTLPAGLESLDAAELLPFVVLPHGGPTSRDLLRFDYWVQFLVSRGYGVLQMNFRGSAGYGQSFVNAGNRQWGQAMQDDITDGTGWLVEQGYADPERIAIVGGSYGGYAALMGVVKTPETYQCAVSFAGVTDLPELIRQVSRYINGRYSARFIGRLWSDRRMLAENSPARRADEIQVPVLLMHGNIDLSVDIEQSMRMARALERSGAEYEFIRMEGGDHHLSLYHHRLQFLQKTDEFLQSCIGT